MLSRLLKKFESETNKYKIQARRTYRKAFLSFKHFVYDRFISDQPFCIEVIAEWYVFLRLKGINVAKSYFYIDKLGNLYSATRETDKKTEPPYFRNIRKSIKAVQGEEKRNLPAKIENVIRLQNLIKNSQPGSLDSLGFDLLLFSLCMGGCPVRDMINLKKTDLESLNPAAQKIAKKYTDNKRKYVFPLNQIRSTPKQGRLHVTTLLDEVLPKIGISEYDDIDNLLYLLWICTAVFYGVSPSVIRSIRELPHDLNFLTLCEPKPLTGEEKESLILKMADLVCSGKEKWFALKLRPRVSFEDLLAKVAKTDDKKITPAFFYPCDEIARKVGKKVVWKDRPVISDIVFIKTHTSTLVPFLRNVWELAWCYREYPGGPYGEIPSKSMEDFQKAIDIFTPEFEIAPIGGFELKEKDRVIIVGGNYKDLKARILSKDKSSEDVDTTIYRVELLDYTGRSDIGIEARYLRPL